MNQTIRTLTTACVSAFVISASSLAMAMDSNELAVTTVNKSEPVLCAEKDNVALEFTSPAIRHMRIQAVHPAYIGMIQTDRWAPDFTACVMSGDAAVTSTEPRRVTLFETPDLWLIGYAFPTFWRPANTPVRVGDHVERGLHLIQLWTRHRERPEEVLVVYPADGYWRARPLPFGEMRWTAYGSSFLLGPVETQGRPVVDLKSIDFDPPSKTFSLEFARGGSARVTVGAIESTGIRLEVSYSDGMPNGLPFAAMRSMYVTDFNADVSRVAWRAGGQPGWGESAILPWKGGDITELWAGRVTPSNHNLSAPDMVFSRFSE
jgi:hypothetical protein